MKIKVVARGYVILKYLISLMIGATAAILFAVKGQILFTIIIVLVPAILTHFLISKFDKGEVELEVLDSGLKVFWLKQLPLLKRESRIYTWHEIQDYVFQPDQYFDIFRIRLKNKDKIKFNLSETSEEFYKFLNKFENKINKLSKTDSAVTIEKAKTVYETTYGLIVAIVLGIIIIGAIWNMIFGRPTSSMNYGRLIAAICGGIFFILQVYFYRRKK